MLPSPLAPGGTHLTAIPEVMASCHWVSEPAPAQWAKYDLIAQWVPGKDPGHRTSHLPYNMAYFKNLELKYFRNW